MMRSLERTKMKEGSKSTLILCLIVCLKHVCEQEVETYHSIRKNHLFEPMKRVMFEDVLKH